jgi:subtilisin family serine protease
VGSCPNGSDRQSGAGAAEDDQGHGTGMTGVITSNGTVSPVGVAPDAEIVAIKVLDESGYFYYFSEIVAALDFIINNRPDVDIINMSLGTFALFSGDCDDSTAYNMAGAAAINTLRAMGVTAFAASGNETVANAMRSPACLSNVVSVGSVNELDVVSGFSNTSATLDVLAPGDRILTDYRFNATVIESGTSLASPHAAGCAALFIDEENGASPDLIEFRLEASPVRVTDPENGLSFPRIDCAPRFCEGDFDHDGDFDGEDLAGFSAGSVAGLLDAATYLSPFAKDFGRSNCP